MRRLALNGFAGRMGETVQEAVAGRQDATVVLGVTPGGEDSAGVGEGRSGGTVPVVDPADRREALATRDVDVVIDFSTADAVASLADDCAAAGVGLVSGTTDLDADTMDALRDASTAVPVLHATNFSRGIYALAQALDAALASLAAYDIEVVETHHNGKQDAPSGTAKTLLETIADHREFDTVYGRSGTHPRDDQEVGMLVRRAGAIRGEHEVLLADNDEVLTLTHRAEDRGVFADGALDGAVQLADCESGWYTLADLFEDHS